MKKLMQKYAKTLLKTCLKIEKDQPLFISANLERLDFVRIVAEEAYKLGITDIYFDLSDSIIKHDLLKNLSLEDLKKSQYWNKEIWNVYARKNAAFLMLASETPGLMKDIAEDKLMKINVYVQETKKEFNDLRNKSKLAWCIAAVPTLSWAKEVYPKEKDPVKKLWNMIFKICAINEDNPEKYWDAKIRKLKSISDKLNKYNFKTLKYKNSLGTDFEIELPKDALWMSGNEILQNGKEIMVNFPTEEVFTSPLATGINGVVYSSKPLCYQDNLIEDFCITFEKGKVVKVKAKKGQKILEGLINSCKNMDRLGEVALVEYDSAISKSNLIFFETLFDENAACHLALGDSFAECMKNGVKMNNKDLEKSGLNKSLNHVDFMIGTKDLKITGTTFDNKEILIFDNGNFSKDFK